MKGGVVADGSFVVVVTAARGEGQDKEDERSYQSHTFNFEFNTII